MKIMKTKKKIVLLTGQGMPAICAANIYFPALGSQFEFFIVQEKNITFSKAIRFLKMRLIRKGLFNVLDILALRFARLFMGHETFLSKGYEPYLEVSDVNDLQVQALIRQVNPDFVITNACSILRQSLLQSIACPIINVHNGINPRYRGTGNFWAFYENNLSCTGVTVHHIDAGIDTGQRIAIRKIDFKAQAIRFEDIDVYAFSIGAQMVIDFLLNSEKGVPPEFSHLQDGLYSYPGLSDYLKACKNYRRYLQSNSDMEKIWLTSFQAFATDPSKTNLERLHWNDVNIVDRRDRMMHNLCREYLSPGDRVLDSGCGDGRYGALLENIRYVGCDYSFPTLKLSRAGLALAQGEAGKLPFPAETFELSLAVGLFQHLLHVQGVADELERVTKRGGYILINTLRQFSAGELILIALASVLNWSQLELVWAIFRKDYLSGRVIEGTLVARRYSEAEMRNLFQRTGSVSVFYHSGWWGSSFLSREITILVCKH